MQQNTWFPISVWLHKKFTSALQIAPSIKRFVILKPSLKPKLKKDQKTILSQTHTKKRIVKTLVPQNSVQDYRHQDSTSELHVSSVQIETYP